MLIHDFTLQPTDRAPVASNRLILAQRRSLQSPKADAGGINQHRKRGQYLGVDFLHFGNRSDFSPKKKTITSTTSARLLKRKSAVLRVRQRNTNRAYNRTVTTWWVEDVRCGEYRLAPRRAQDLTKQSHRCIGA